jgi:hypothetical protein
LLYKIFSGALIILGALGAYFTRPSPPRRSTALRQQFAIANSTTDSGLLLFPKNLLFYKIFSGALMNYTLGVFHKRAPHYVSSLPFKTTIVMWSFIFYKIIGHKFSLCSITISAKKDYR